MSYKTSAKACFRRVSLILARPGEGRLTEPTAAIQRWRRELIFTCSAKKRGAAAYLLRLREDT